MMLIPLIAFGCMLAGDEPITAARQTEVVSATAKALKDRYVFPAVGKQMSDALRESTRKADLPRKTFAEELTRTLRSISKDKHLSVVHERWSRPSPTSGEPTWQERASMTNQGLTEARFLPGNVGYLRLDGMFETKAVEGPLAGAMRYLKTADALILDVRTNGGGYPSTVALICAYLFPSRTLVNRFYSRLTDKSDESWTPKTVSGPRFVDKPVYILTSKGTFSGGEELPYTLQAYGRAIVVGSSTGGGANPYDEYDLPHGFVLNLPSARPVHPKTGTNWEGVGVQPDIVCQEGQALRHAHEAALKALLAKDKVPVRRRIREEALAALAKSDTR